jgi:hypothetical protein
MVAILGPKGSVPKPRVPKQGHAYPGTGRGPTI